MGHGGYLPPARSLDARHHTGVRDADARPHCSQGCAAAARARAYLAVGGCWGRPTPSHRACPPRSTRATPFLALPPVLPGRGCNRAMAVPRADDEQPVLRLMPPAAGSPTEPTCYKSPAKPTMKRECTRVGRVSSYEQLIQLGDERDRQNEADEAAGEDGEDGEDGVVVKTNKKSAFMVGSSVVAHAAASAIALASA